MDAYLANTLRRLTDKIAAGDTPSQEDIFTQVKDILPGRPVHASGGLPDARGLSDVDISLYNRNYTDMMGQFPEGTSVEHKPGRSIYALPGYERPVAVYVSNEIKRLNRALRHRRTELALAEQYPDLASEAYRVKQTGLGTEKAWASVLGAEGDPYEALLNKRKMLRLAARASAERMLGDKTAAAAPLPGRGNSDNVSSRHGYLLKGCDLQTVGLRKNIHALLDSRGISGMAVNVADTGNIELTINSPSRLRAREAVKLIRDKIRADFDPDMRIVKRNSGTGYRKVAMDIDALNALNLHNNLQYIRSGLYKPEKASLMPIEELREGLISRYRLESDQEGVLRGYVPDRAYRQLKGTEPMYSHFTPDNLVRDHDEAVRLQQHHLAGTKLSSGYSVNPELMEHINTRVLPEYAAFDEAHREDHARTVMTEALRMGAIHNADPNMVAAAAAYHDMGLKMGDRETHHLNSEIIIKKDRELRKFFKKKQIAEIALAARQHRASLDEPVDGLLSKIIGDADRSPDIDTVIGRTIQYRRNNNMSRDDMFRDSYGHLVEKFGEDGYVKYRLPETLQNPDIIRVRKLLKNKAATRRVFNRLYRDIMTPDDSSAP